MPTCDLLCRSRLFEVKPLLKTFSDLINSLSHPWQWIDNTGSWYVNPPLIRTDVVLTQHSVEQRSSGPRKPANRVKQKNISKSSGAFFECSPNPVCGCLSLCPQISCLICTLPGPGESFVWVRQLTNANVSLRFLVLLRLEEVRAGVSIHPAWLDLWT